MSGTAEAGDHVPGRGRVSTGDTVVETKLATRADRLLHEHRHRRRFCANLRGRPAARRLDRLGRRLEGSYLEQQPPWSPWRTGRRPHPPDRTVSSATARLHQHYAEIGTPGGGARPSPSPRSSPTTGTARGVAFEAGSPRLRSRSPSTTPRCGRPVRRRRSGLTLRARGPTVDGRLRSSPRRLHLSFIVHDPRSASPCFVASAALAFALVVARRRRFWIGRRGRAATSPTSSVVRHAVPDPAGRIVRPPGLTVIDVSDPEALHKVAERFDTLVLHHAGD